MAGMQAGERAHEWFTSQAGRYRQTQAETERQTNRHIPESER